METLLRTIERFIPKKVYKALQPAYHFLLALTGTILYRHLIEMTIQTHGDNKAANAFVQIEIDHTIIADLQRTLLLS